MRLENPQEYLALTVYHSQGVVILLAQSYKLNSVCNAEVYHMQVIPAISIKGCAQKSITREV